MKYFSERVFVLLMMFLFGAAILGGIMESAAEELLCHADIPYSWRICSEIPENICDTDNYVVCETIDFRLTYIRGSPVVKLCIQGEEELTMMPGAHYTLEEGISEKEFEGVGFQKTSFFRITLTAAGKEYVMNNLTDCSHMPELRIYYDTAPDNPTVVLNEMNNQDIN